MQRPNSNTLFVSNNQQIMSQFESRKVITKRVSLGKQLDAKLRAYTGANIIDHKM